jgi:biotin carboxyl carrier protein
MSTYCVSIGEHEYQVQITEEHPLVNGESVPCDLVSLNGNGMHQLSRGTQSLDVYLSPLPNSHYEAYVAGRRIVARVDSAQRARHRSAAQPEAGDLRAPMPGLIVETLVKEGDLVESGQTIVVEESMKMQMQLRAPFAGRVERVAAKPGAQVEKGALLVKVAARAG